MKGSIHIFLKFTGILAFQFLYCQVFPQKVNQLSVLDSLRSYNSKTIQEKLYLHTDKEFYIAGEILWFKIYYTDGAYHRPMNLSNVAYTEILNERNESVLQATIPLQPGKGSSSFYLPVNLATGTYSMRAYTRWMKNFDEGYFFEKKITIVNTLKNPGPVNPADSIPTSVNFFPEGGNLVSGIQSRVGFFVKDGGSGLNSFRGYIIDKNGDTVTSFRPLKLGIGSFDFTPLAGNSYKAVVLLPDGKIISKILPEIFNSGYVMKVTENNTGHVIVSVKRKMTAGTPNTEPILLLSHTRQIPVVAEIRSMNGNDSVVFLIDKKKISKGISHFTIFNGNNQPVCERLFFNKPSSRGFVRVITDNDEYRNRELVNLSLAAENIYTVDTVFNLSASVFYIDTLQPSNQVTIYSYMWLASDLAGVIESPDYYFTDDPDAALAADNLMLTHGWRRFKWNDILNGQHNFVKYLPEVNGLLIDGVVKDTRNGKPAQGISSFLTVSGQPFGFYTSRSNEQGGVLYELKDFYGNGQLIAQRGLVEDSFYKVEITKSYVETVTGRKYAPYLLKENVKQQLLQRSLNMQVQNIYSGDSLRSFMKPVISDTLPFYGQAEHSYMLDNYKRFITMEEVLREYVTEIGVNLRRGVLHMRIFDPGSRNFYESNSLVLLDGVALSNADKIFSYDPLKVKRLDVIQSRYIYGQTFFNGIASFITYDGVFNGFELDPGLVAINFNGLQMQREFYSPLYKSKEEIESRIPDLRNTLLWRPDIYTDRNGKASLQLYTSDQKGKYVVMIQGMNGQGDFVSGMTMFEVK